MECEGWLRQEGQNAAGRIRIGPEGFTFEPHAGASGKRISVSVGGLEKAPAPSKKKPTLQVTMSAAPKEPFVLDFGPAGNEDQAVERRDAVRDALIKFLLNRGPTEPAVLQDPTIGAQTWEDLTATIRADPNMAEDILKTSRAVLVEGGVMTEDEFTEMRRKCQYASGDNHFKPAVLGKPMDSCIPAKNSAKHLSTTDEEKIEIDDKTITSHNLDYPLLEATWIKHRNLGMSKHRFYELFYDYRTNGDSQASQIIQYIQRPLP